FGTVGKLAAFDLQAAVESEGLYLPKLAKILDFGCGCGRIIQWFRILYPDAEIYGTDIDKEAIEWCARNLALTGQFSVNEERPPLAYKDNFFDFVFSISIFTHLPENMQFEWLSELRRVTKPGGLLAISVQNEHLLYNCGTRAQKNKMKKRGFYYRILHRKTDG